MQRIPKLLMTDLYLLFSVYLLEGADRFIDVNSIGKVMKRNRHFSSLYECYQDCAALTEKGYLLTNGDKPVKYKLSVDGMNLLNTIEKKARKERWDR